MKNILFIVAICLYSVTISSQDLQGPVHQIDPNADTVRIGGGIIPILVRLDTIVYYSNCDCVDGVEPKWIKDFHVFKEFQEIVIEGDTLLYRAVVTPKKRHFRRIKVYISENNIRTAPNNK